MTDDLAAKVAALKDGQTARVTSDGRVKVYDTGRVEIGGDVVRFSDDTLSTRLVTYTRRAYLAIQVLFASGCDAWTALESVDSTALAHPEWDMAEERTWDEWETTGGTP